MIKMSNFKEKLSKFKTNLNKQLNDESLFGLCQKAKIDYILHGFFDLVEEEFNNSVEESKNELKYKQISNRLDHINEALDKSKHNIRQLNNKE